MNFLRNIFFLLLFALPFFYFYFPFGIKNQTKEKGVWKIGILQTAAHPALDAVREGFYEAVKEKGALVEYVFKNADASPATAHLAAQQYASDKDYDLFLAIATPAVLALGKAEKERPLIAAAITDPVALGLSNKDHVCGVVDAVSPATIIEEIKRLFPQADSISLMYSPSEPNSIAHVKEISALFEKEGIKVQHVQVPTEAELAIQTDHALRDTKLLLATTTHLIANGAYLVALKAEKVGVPFVACDPLLVERGATVGIGVDYYKIGQQAGEMAISLLSGQKQIKDYRPIPSFQKATLRFSPKFESFLKNNS